MENAQSKQRGFPTAAVAAIVIIAAFEIFIGSHRRWFQNGYDQVVFEKRDWLASSARRDDVVIFGDSRHLSIRPDAVVEALGGGLRGANYAWSFMGVEGYDYMLQAYLSRKPAPRLIVTGFMPDYLALPPNQAQMSRSKEWRVRAIDHIPGAPLLKAALADRSWRMFWDYLTCELTPPSGRYRERIVKGALDVLSGLGWPALPANERNYIDSVKQRGWMQFFTTETAKPDAVEGWDRIAGPLRPYNNPAAVERFERFLQRAAGHNIRVLLLNAPVSKRLYDLYEKRGVLARYLAFIDRCAARFPNFETIEPVLQAYPDNEFADVGHLNSWGERKFLAFYRDALRRYSSDSKTKPHGGNVP